MLNDLTPIEIGVAYPLADFRKRTGMSEHSLRQAKRGGLVVIRAGNCRWVLGKHWEAYLLKLAEQQSNGCRNNKPDQE